MIWISSDPLKFIILIYEVRSSALSETSLFSETLPFLPDIVVKKQHLNIGGLARPVFSQDYIYRIA